MIKLPDSFCSSFQHQTSDKENDENEIGKCSREVHHFAARLDTFAQAGKNYNPGEKNTQSQVPFDFANVSKLLKKRTGIKLLYLLGPFIITQVISKKRTAITG